MALDTDIASHDQRIGGEAEKEDQCRRYGKKIADCNRPPVGVFFKFAVAVSEIVCPGDGAARAPGGFTTHNSNFSG